MKPPLIQKIEPAFPHDKGNPPFHSKRNKLQRDTLFIMPMKFCRALLKTALVKCGYQLRVAPRGTVWDLATHLRKVFEELQIDTVLDVGANEGQYAQWLRSAVGFQGTILSFEPVKAVHEILAQKATLDNRWHTFQMALGSETGSREINIGLKSVFSSFLPATQEELDIYQDQNIAVARELVTINRLDDLWPKLKQLHGIKRPLLKLDTQGFDLQVIRGGTAAIKSVPLLQTELSFLPLYKDMPDFKLVWNSLQDQGFDLCGIYPVFHDNHGRLAEADGVFLNRGWHNQMKKQN